MSSSRVRSGKAATISRSYSKTKQDFSEETSSPSKSVPSFKSKHSNGDAALSPNPLSPLFKPPSKHSKSTFYTSTDQLAQDERVQPASCTHSARLTREDAGSIMGSCSDLSNPGELAKSLSIPDLHSLSKSSKKSAKKEKYATLRSTRSSKRFIKSMKVRSSKGEGQDSASDDWSDVSFSGSVKAINLSAKSDELPETSYQSYNDLEPKKLSDPSATLKDIRLWTCSSYRGGVLRELGQNGGVISIVGCDVSLHISPRLETHLMPCPTCLASTNVKLTRHGNLSTTFTQKTAVEKKTGSSKKFQKLIARTSTVKVKGSEPKLIDYDCPVILEQEIDGRMVLSLEDPPSFALLSSKFVKPKLRDHQAFQTYRDFAIAGPSIRLDVKDGRSVTHGAIIQLPINVVLKQTDVLLPPAKSSVSLNKVCAITCLQSTSHNGPYSEVKSSYLCDDNLQVTADLSKILPEDEPGGKKCEVHLMPVVKLLDKSLSSPWEGIARKTFHVGIYGPRHSYYRTTYCLSLSSSGFNLPFLKLDHDQDTTITLRLLDSYVIQAHKIQGYQMSVKTSSSSFLLDTDLLNSAFTEEELRSESRMQRFFALKYNDRYQSSKKTPKKRSKRRFTVLLTGMTDQNRVKISCECPRMSNFKFPRGFSPAVAKRLAVSIETSPVSAVEAKLRDTAFQWLIGKHEDLLKFQEQSSVPSSKREVFGVKLGLSIKPSPNKKKVPNLPMYFLQYPNDEYLPVLSRYTMLLADSRGNKKEWWICYYKHCIGLVRSSSVRMLGYDDFSDWLQVRISVGKIVEAITKPVLKLQAEALTIQEKLIQKVQNWISFSTSLSFGQTFAASAISKEQNEKQREDKVKFYLQKYMEYRTISGMTHRLHYDILKALIYSEHFELAVELTTDLAMLNTATTIDPSNWPQLAHMLIGRAVEEDYQKFAENSVYAFVEEVWRPIYDYLCNWRERFGDNHKGTLFALHQAVGNLPETCHSLNQILTDLVILVRAFETLCQYDTNL